MVPKHVVHGKIKDSTKRINPKQKHLKKQKLLVTKILVQYI